MRVVAENTPQGRMLRRADYSGDAAMGAIEAHCAAMDGGPGRVLKRSPETNVTLPDVAPPVCVKQFKARSFWRSVKDYIRPSPARRSWTAGLLLERLGFAAPRVMALLLPSALGRDAFLVMSRVQGATESYAFARDILPALSTADRRRLMESAGLFLRRLHDAGVFHGDLKASNLLIRGQERDYSFDLVDLASVRRPLRLTQVHRVHNFAQLHAALPRWVTRTDRLRVLRAYGAFADIRAAWRQIVRRASRRHCHWIEP